MKALLTLLVTTLIIILVAILNVDYAVKNGIELYGSQALGVPVTVDRVMCNPFTGVLTVEGITIANPPTFTPAPLLHVDTMDVRVAAISRELVTIKTLTLTGVTLHYEAGLPSNVDTLAAHFVTADDTAAPNFAIRRLIIRNGRARVSIPLIPTVTWDAPTLTLLNLGAEMGLRFKQLGAQIKHEIFAKIT